MSSPLLQFTLLKSKTKTTVWNVATNEKLTTPLGVIKWYAHWRRYCFFPANNCLYDATCLKQIIFKIDQLMNDRRCL